MAKDSRAEEPSATALPFQLAADRNVRAPVWSLLLVAVAIGVSACARWREDALPQSASTSPHEIAALLPKSKLLAPFKLAETQERRFSTELTFTNQEHVVKVEIIRDLDRDSAQTLLHDGIMGLEALYANALSPYPGDISKEVVSDARFRPQFVRTNWNGQTLHYFLLFANERLGYGATTTDVVKYRSLLGWLYCERTGVFYKVRYFAPLTARTEDLESFFLSLSCR